MQNTEKYVLNVSFHFSQNTH